MHGVYHLVAPPSYMGSSAPISLGHKRCQWQPPSSSQENITLFGIGSSQRQSLLRCHCQVGWHTCIDWDRYYGPIKGPNWHSCMRHHPKTTECSLQATATHLTTHYRLLIFRWLIFLVGMTQAVLLLTINIPAKSTYFVRLMNPLPEADACFEPGTNLVVGQCRWTNCRQTCCQNDMMSKRHSAEKTKFQTDILSKWAYSVVKWPFPIYICIITFLLFFWTLTT